MSAALADLPPPERFAHGTRARYVGAKCRCDRCRAANTAYHRERKAAADAAARALSSAPVLPGPCPGVNGQPCPRGSRVRKDSTGGVCEACRNALVFNGPVDAAPVLEHLRQLSKLGVGYKSAADAADVGRSTIGDLMRSGGGQLRADAARRLLAIDAGAAADHSVVPAGPTWALIRRLLAAGCTRGRIAQQGLGLKNAALQIQPRRVLARTALAVERFARRELGVLQLMRRRCPLCGHKHEDDREAAAYCFDEIAKGITSARWGELSTWHSTRDQVLELVERAAPIGPAEIAERLGFNLGAVQQHLSRACRRGAIVRVAVGQYAPPPKET